MSSKRFIAPLAMAVTGVLALAPSALANHPDDSYGAASCVLAGVAGTAAIIAGEDGVNGIPHDLFPPSGNPNATPDLDNDTDPGHFQFNGTAVCSGADTAWEGGTPLTGPPPNKIPVIPPTVFTLQAGGDYDNVLTGTGTANGDAKISHPTIPAGTFDSGTTVFTEFSIDFAGGVGHLDFVVDADESAPFTCVNGQIATAPSQDQLPYVPLDG